MGDGLDTMKDYKEKSKVRNGAPTSEVGLTLNGEIVVGKFVDRDRPDYASLMRAQYVEALGDRYVDCSLSNECFEGECSESATGETVCN
jgi:2-oxoglutarate ferredoxin oxidoreductase subunit beta